MSSAPPGESNLRFLRFRAAVLAALAVVLSAAAGCRDGTVKANGKVLIEGKPAARGRLSLSPIGDGPRAHSLVGDEGEFALRTSQGSTGAFPGVYRVTFQQRLDKQTRAGLAGDMAGELDVDELTVVYRSARDKPFVIPEADSDDLVLNIRQELGWERMFSE